MAINIPNISRDDIERELNLNYLKRRIKVKELDIEAVITAVFISDNGMKFQCRYFWNGDIKETYFYSHELEFNL